MTCKALYKAVEKYDVTVIGGTGGGAYKEGESVTITANDPAEGKVFKGWQDESGEIVSTDKSYTFTVTGKTTLTAVYEDIAPTPTPPTPTPPTPTPPTPTPPTPTPPTPTPPTPTPQPGTDTKPTTEKQGLSGGAIAGIVIGSVLVVGLGGFAVFWFVIRKKTWADFMAAVKGVFAKKQ